MVNSGSESDTGSVTADVLDGDEYNSDRDQPTLARDEVSLIPATTTTRPTTGNAGKLRLEAASLFDARYKPVGSQQVLLGPAPRSRKPSATDRTPTASSFSLTPKPKLAVALSPRSVDPSGAVAFQPFSEYAFAEAGPSSPNQLASPWDAPQYTHPPPLAALPLDSVALDRATNHPYKSKLFRSHSSSSSASASSDKIVRHTRRQHDPERRRSHTSRHPRSNGVDTQNSSNSDNQTQAVARRRSGRHSGPLSGGIVDSPQSSDVDVGHNHDRQQLPRSALSSDSESPSRPHRTLHSTAPAPVRSPRQSPLQSPHPVRDTASRPDRLAGRLSDLRIGPLSDIQDDRLPSTVAPEDAQRPGRPASSDLRVSPAAGSASRSIPALSIAQPSPLVRSPKQADSTLNTTGSHMAPLQPRHSPYSLRSPVAPPFQGLTQGKEESRRRKPESSKLPFGRSALLDTPVTSSDDAANSKSCRATPIGSAALVERIKERRQRDYEGRPLLLLDLRPLQDYLTVQNGDDAASGSRIRQSINVNFPSLLIKRFRKGNVTAFNLESFITTAYGQQLNKRFCPASSDVFCPLTANVDICILDEQISQKEFANLETTASVGAVLVSVLQKRRQAALDSQSDDACICSKAKCELWYHDGTMPQLLDFARSVHPDLVASGSDDLDDEMPPSPPAARSTHAVSPPVEQQASHSLHPRLPFVKSSSDLKRAKVPPTLSLPTKSLSLPPSSATQSNFPNLPPPSPGFGTHFHPPPGPRTKKPSLLAKLDTSDQIRLPQVNTALKTAPAVESPRPKKAPNSLAPARSFQELALAQSNTPTRSTFARAAGLQPIQSGRLAVGGDDYENMPPPTPSFGQSFQPHDRGRSMSVDSNASNASNASNSQYPTFGSSMPNNILQNGYEHQDTANNDAVVPFSVSVIIPGFLYLGPEPARQSDVEQLEAHGIKRILNMAVECETQERWGGRFEKIATIPMRDSLAEVHVQERIREACVLLDDADLHGKPTYVHCKAGKSRSVTIVLAYLIHRNHWPLKRAYSHVSDRRQGVCPNIGFVAELMRFEENELGFKSQGVLGSGNTPEPVGKTRNGYFRSHSKTLSNASTATDASALAAARISPDHALHSPATARSASRDSLPSPAAAGASYIPTSLEGRPSIVRHLSLIASSAMNLTADQAGSKGVKEAKMAARSARVRDSLPPNVSLGGWLTTSNTPLSSPSMS